MLDTLVASRSRNESPELVASACSFNYDAFGVVKILLYSVASILQCFLGFMGSCSVRVEGGKGQDGIWGAHQTRPLRGVE